MGLSVGNPVLASDFIALKARVKAECKRRKYKGSITKYAGEEYDYEEVPVQGGLVLPEHYNKLIYPLSQINDTGYELVESGDIVESLDDLRIFLTASEAFPLHGTSTNCKSSCTGLCLGGCGNTCTGCGGACSSSCSSSCSGGCSGGCGGGCGSTCSTGCSEGDCSGACYDKCTNTCQGTCVTGCKSGCKGTCTGSCTSGCSGTCVSQVAIV